MNQTISRKELESQLDSPRPPLLVEALPQAHYAKAHLPGAINIPPDRVAELAPTRLPERDRGIVVYCANAQCRNSAIAAELLRKLGYTDVREYAAGKQDWIEAGLNVEPSAAAA